MKKIIFLFSIMISITILASFKVAERYYNAQINIEKTTTVQEVLELLGDEAPNHTAVEGASAALGEALFKTGIAKKEGGRSGVQSKHFVCTSCHNTVKEDPDLRSNDPQARLEYSAKNDIPFLQGTSMYGAVDRRKFYNGDYYLKYGESVKKANNDLREAIQLCAVECSQGRLLDNVELESTLAYLWTIGLKMEDLTLSEDDWQRIKADAKDKQKHTELVTFIKSFYMDDSPATFIKPPTDRKAGYGLAGNADNGKLVYDQSCKHCHENMRYSFFDLDDSKMTFQHLKKNFSKDNRYSVYNLIRNGTYPVYGKGAYMPRYTKEKLTDQMVEDLRAYVERESK